LAAVADATETAAEPVPLQLRNAITPLMKRTGYGGGYRYVHDDPQAREEMSCLPERLQGKVYYEENDQEERNTGVRSQWSEVRMRNSDEIPFAPIAAVHVIHRKLALRRQAFYSVS
jgi:replication-associated recombination protein RarA